VGDVHSLEDLGEEVRADIDLVKPDALRDILS
jgi:hypothetical protein